jgi:1-acyl-sn-glycerol-3-phosphate acyltransferase
MNRDRGDIGALRTVMRLLGENKAVLMFPEGTRSRDGQLQEPRAGIGMIVASTGAPIVPLRIFGSDRAMPRGKWLPRPVPVRIVFGEPFTYPLPADFDGWPGDRRKELYLEIGREIMRRIASLEPLPARR